MLQLKFFLHKIMQENMTVLGIHQGHLFINCFCCDVYVFCKFPQSGSNEAGL